jgi:hypothetical protein
MTVSITFRTDDASRWGFGQSFDLEPQQVDGNFFELKTAVEDLQANPPQPVQIASFTVSGSGILITMSDGSTVGPLPLPILAWRWRDAWMPFVPYAPLDVFQVAGVGIFLVLQEHAAAASFDPAATAGGQALYQALFGITADSQLNGGLAAGMSQDWGLIGAPVSATADWGLISDPVTLRIDLGEIGR